MLTKFETKSARVKGLSFHSKRPWVLASEQWQSLKILSQDDLDHILNTTGELPENLGDLDSEDEGQVDNLEFEELYDSDINQDYNPANQR
ncbi:Coatomer subunit alpha-like 1 [Homarus americanus]|uniref:Coatomer subunit alpha-like 1 n=1 Tax=Homarus americanus TaxID=6706 RepID=A0A8J5MVD4_HOMAM|nr:Coatomer subunit alpha-like 1 [Homarus americanus]